VSRPDHGPDVAVDFSPPRQRDHRPLAALVLVVLILGGVTVAVTQLLLH
jgi:hypothetical protein